MVDLKTVQMVLIQINAQNPDALPHAVRFQEQERPLEAAARRDRNETRANGRQVVPPTPDCSLADFLGQIHAAGFTIIDAFRQRRLHQNKSGVYHTCRFTLVRRSSADAQSTDPTGYSLADAHDGLARVLVEGLYQVRIYLNPVFDKDHQPIPGAFCLSINLDARRPLYYPDGKRITIWEKVNGRKVKVPLEGRARLACANNTIALV